MILLFPAAAASPAEPAEGLVAEFAAGICGDILR
jgi:hypothetical protein